MTTRIVAANDNARTRGATGYPLKELFEKGDLGISEIENRRHWQDAKRFKKAMADARGEPLNDTMQDDWRELRTNHVEFAADSMINRSDPFQASETALNDEMEFEEANIDGASFIVDNAEWNPFRDLPPFAEPIEAKQTIALAAEVLGPDYPILCAAIDRNWTTRQIGETEGYVDRVTAAACGKGMLRGALRKLSLFFLALDRLEAGAQRGNAIWPLLGTDAWRFMDVPDARWKRTGEPAPKLTIYLAA